MPIAPAATWIGTCIAGGDALPQAPTRPALIAVAHGSRDPRSAETVSAVVADIAAARPDIDVRLAFLDLNAPSLEQVVAAVATQGHTQAVVVPLLLGSAFHARVDLPGLLAAARTRHPQLRLTQADVLGPDHGLIAALRDRVLAASAKDISMSGGAHPTEARTGQSRSQTMRDRLVGAAHAMRGPGAPSSQRRTGGPTSQRRIGVAVAAVGSSSPAANARTAAVARQLAALTGWQTEICYATTDPSVTEAVARLRARGADDILVAPWFLAHGLLTDRLQAAAPDLTHTDVLGPHAALTNIVWDRYNAAATHPAGLPLSA